MSTLWRKVDRPVDFVGQASLKDTYQIGLIASGIVCYGVGFATQNQVYTWLTLLGGLIVLFFVVVPPWSTFRQNPIDWLEPLEDMQPVKSKKTKKSSKSKKSSKKSKKRDDSSSSSSSESD